MKAPGMHKTGTVPVTKVCQMTLSASHDNGLYISYIGRLIVKFTVSVDAMGEFGEVEV